MQMVTNFRHGPLTCASLDIDMTARIYVHPRDFFRFFPIVEAGVNAGDASTGSDRLGVYARPLGRTPFGFAF